MIAANEIHQMSSQASISLPPVSVIGKIEDEFNTTDDQVLDATELNIDFSNVEYFDIQSMVFLLSITYSRYCSNKITRFILPSKNNPKKINTLIVLHTWRFFDVLTEITGNNKLDYIVNPESFSPVLNLETISLNDGTDYLVLKETKYFLEQSKKYFSKIYRDDEGLKTLQFDQNFFQLTSKPFYKRSEKIATLNETPIKWGKNSLIVSVLEKNINENKGEAEEEKISIGNKLANDIIRESLTNCVRHPNANLLVTGCFFDRSSKQFTIVIWDNGKSIAQSLFEGLKENGTLRLNDSFDKIINLGFNPSYFLPDGTEDSSKLNEIDVDSKFVFSDNLPKVDDPYWRFLLASFYPGVSRDPDKKDKENSQLEELSDEIQADHSGMGLTVLLDSVVKIFGGTVSARINNHFVSIKNIERQFLQTIYRKKKNEVYLSQQSERYVRDKIDTTKLKKTNFVYQVKIVKKKDSIPFRGNMLTIKIPIS